MYFIENEKEGNHLEQSLVKWADQNNFIPVFLCVILVENGIALSWRCIEKIYVFFEDINAFASAVETMSAVCIFLWFKDLKQIMLL